MKLTKAIFAQQMNRMAETFGKDSFPKPRIEEIWKVVSELPEQDFIRIISRLVGEHPIKYPPTVVNFRELAETKLKELRDAKGPQGWESVANEIEARKQKLAAMTPEEREARKLKIQELVKSKIR